ncbi:MAG: ATP synthase F1 subunit gamma [Turicibacter sp.]|nr:ATP synthase F1 subunit gamma [Turicibacter sp.]
MSVSTNDIKKKISATENMSKITKAMQMVSVSKLGKTENRVQQFRDYYAELKTILATLQASEYVTEHLFKKGHDKKTQHRIGCVVITSNRGLVGGYNNSLFKMLKTGDGYNNELFKLVDKKVASDDDFRFYMTGQKGAIFAKNELPAPCTTHFLFPDEVQYTDIMALAGKLITDYLTGEITEVVILHQDFVSKLEQAAVKTELLPLDFGDLPTAKDPNYEIKPSEQDVVDGLLLQYVMASLYEIFLNANQAEHAARMNSMSNATDNAEDIIKESKLLYNRARQAAITQELNEIVAGANAVN